MEEPKRLGGKLVDVTNVKFLILNAVCARVAVP